MTLQRADGACIVALGVFTAGHVALSGDSLHQSILELLGYVVLMALGWVLTRSLPATDRTIALAVLGALGAFALRKSIMIYRGEPMAVGPGLIVAACRHGFAGGMLAWTALISIRRPAGQYAYNVSFVAAFSFLLGQVAANFASRAPNLLLGAPAAFLLGGAIGSAFSLATMEARDIESRPPEARQ